MAPRQPLKKAKVTFKSLARRITGISLPVFGVSWNPPAPERDVIRETFVFLEDRRALYNDFANEMEDQVEHSVQAIRAELTAALKRLPEDSEAVAPLRAMRAACREYLDTAPGRNRQWGPHWSQSAFTTALGRLRAMVGIQVAYLAVKYGIDLDGELLRVIPPELRDAAYLGD